MTKSDAWEKSKIGGFKEHKDYKHSAMVEVVPGSFIPAPMQRVERAAGKSRESIIEALIRRFTNRGTPK